MPIILFVGVRDRVQGVLSSLFRGLRGSAMGSTSYGAVFNTLLHAVTDTHLAGAPR